MKTVQQWLQSLDESQLTGTYFAEHPVNFETIRETGLTLAFIREAERKHFQEFLKRMEELPAKQLPNDTVNVFFGCNAYREGTSGIDVYMCKLGDIMKPGSPQTYSWIVADQDEVLNSLVADTELTKKEIYSVIANILYEATFFGYTQQEIETERKKLDESLAESLDEAERGDTITLDAFRKSLGLEPEPKDVEGEKLLKKITCAENEYNQFCLDREISLIRGQLGLPA